jgi:hypothetical protein
VGTGDAVILINIVSQCEEELAGKSCTLWTLDKVLTQVQKLSFQSDDKYLISTIHMHNPEFLIQLSHVVRLSLMRTIYMKHRFFRASCRGHITQRVHEYSRAPSLIERRNHFAVVVSKANCCR